MGDADPARVTPSLPLSSSPTSVSGTGLVPGRLEVALPLTPLDVAARDLSVSTKASSRRRSSGGQTSDRVAGVWGWQLGDQRVELC